MTSIKPNLTRMYRTLVDTYWMEHECLKKVYAKEDHRCFEVLRTREAQLCSVCKGFVTLKQSMRLALEENENRRENTEATRVQ